MFQQGRIELVEDFPTFDHTGDGRIDDNDLLFAVTLRSGKPTQSLELPDTDNTHIAGFVQDDWSVSTRLQLNLGLRYEIDTDVNNQSRVDELNPIVQPFVTGERQRDLNNVSPRVGFAWNVGSHRLLVRGGYGIYYDRVVLQIQTLERGLDGRALPVEVRAGNVFFLDPAPAGCRRSRRHCRIRSPASSCRAPAHRASTSSTRTCRTRPCTSSISASRRASAARTSASTACTTRGSTS